MKNFNSMPSPEAYQPSQNITTHLGELAIELFTMPEAEKNDFFHPFKVLEGLIKKSDDAA